MSNKSSVSGHVALLLPELRVGGAQRVFLTLAKDFVARGVRVDLVLVLHEGELLTEVPPGVRLVPLEGRLSVLGRIALAVSTLPRLVGYLRTNRPDDILSTMTGTNLMAVIAHRLARVPTRLVLREAVTLANLRHPFYLILMRSLYRRADVVVALTDYMKNELEESLRLPSGKVVQIPNPVDVTRIQQDGEEPLPDDYDVSRPYAIAVGRLAPQKDYVTLLNAFAKVAQTSPLKLVILGEGPDKSLLEARIRDLSLGDRVELRSFDLNPYRWIAKASVFVLSSRWEGYPNVLLEALVLGRPVVSTCYDSSIQDLTADQPVALVPVGNVSALAEAINKSIRKPSAEVYSLPAGVLDAPSTYLRIMGLTIPKDIP